MDTEPKTLPVLPDSPPRPAWPVQFVEALFWGLFYALGIPLILLTLLSFRQTSPAALVLKGALLLWGIVLLLHQSGHRLRYWAVGAWTAGLWGLFACLVVHRLRFWLRYGMDSPTHPGSPMAFLFGFVLEQAFFLPLTALLLLLAARGWLRRGGK